MRADRLLSILLLLQVHRRMTARELAKRLEVSERTIYRDMEALSAAGVPVSMERGIGGGCVLLETYRTNLTGLTEVEVQALFLAQPARLLSDLGLQQASEAALLTLQDAVWQERKLHLTYLRGDDTTVERVIDPLGLVAKGSVWYLVAAVEGEMRTYRVSRVQSASITEEACVRPQDFDLAAYWEQSSADFKANLPRYMATIRVEPTLLTYMRYVGRYSRIIHIGLPEADGWVPVEMQFDGEHVACEYALSFGPRIEVVEPEELREKVIEAAEGVVALYARRT